MDLEQLWQAIKKDIYSEITNPAASVYIEDMVPISCTDDEFRTAVSMSISKKMIELRFIKTIENVMTLRLGKPVSLKITVVSNPNEYKALRDGRTNEKREDEEKPTFANAVGLNPKYTFENFVIGSSNAYATAAAQATAEMPGTKNNPLFLYGHSGLGKTHLMHAIGNRIIETRPHFRVVYVSSEHFTNHFINSVRDNKTESFRQFYREADVLLVDDVQFLTNKEATQEEFFHTFNELHNMDKQIVLTSDRMPKELVTLEERLRTRFNSGATIDITMPNYETRLAILKKKAQNQNKNVSEEVLSYIAGKVESNIRELEGALTTLLSLSELNYTDPSHEITMEMAEEGLKKVLPEKENIPITVNKIINKVCDYYDVSKEDIIGKRKTKDIIRPRQVAMYVCRELTDMNYVMISREFGKRDRTTVMSNVDKVQKDLKTDSELERDVDNIIRELRGM